MQASDACHGAPQEVGAAISSALAGAMVEAEQACYLPVSGDSMPVIGKVPGVQGCYMASGEPSVNLSNDIATVSASHQTLSSEAWRFAFSFTACLACKLSVYGLLSNTFLLLTGHSCWGILNGPATGMAMAELIANGKATCVDISALDPGRFTKRGIFR